MGKDSKDLGKIARRSSGRSNGSSSSATLSPPSTSTGNSPPIDFGGRLSDNEANLLQAAQAALSSPRAHARARDPMEAMSPCDSQELKKRFDEHAAEAAEKLPGQNAFSSPFAASNESRPPPYGSTANATPATGAHLGSMAATSAQNRREHNEQVSIRPSTSSVQFPATSLPLPASAPKPARLELSLEVQGRGSTEDTGKCRAAEIVERFDSQLREAVAKARAAGVTLVVTRVSIRNLPVSASGADMLRHWLIKTNVASTVVCLDLQGIYAGKDRHDGDGTGSSTSKSSEPKQGFLVLQLILQPFAGHKKLTHLSIPHNAIGEGVIGALFVLGDCPLRVLNLHDCGLSSDCVNGSTEGGFSLNGFVQTMSSSLTSIDLVGNQEICPNNDDDAPADALPSVEGTIKSCSYLSSFELNSRAHPVTYERSTHRTNSPHHSVGVSLKRKYDSDALSSGRQLLPPSTTRKSPSKMPKCTIVAAEVGLNGKRRRLEIKPDREQKRKEMEIRFASFKEKARAERERSKALLQEIQGVQDEKLNKTDEIAALQKRIENAIVEVEALDKKDGDLQRLTKVQDLRKEIADNDLSRAEAVFLIELHGIENVALKYVAYAFGLFKRADAEQLEGHQVDDFFYFAKGAGDGCAYDSKARQSWKLYPDMVSFEYGHYRGIPKWLDLIGKGSGRDHITPRHTIADYICDVFDIE